MKSDSLGPVEALAVVEALKEMKKCTGLMMLIICIFLGVLATEIPAQDRSKYPTHLKPTGSGIDWVAFYDTADALTATARNELRHHLDIAYGEDPKQKLDLYPPRGEPSGPVFVFIHGGGFVEGDRSHYGYIARPFAADGIATVVISYRLSPNHYPNQVHDVHAALEWVYLKIAAYGADPERIVIGGHSAGAILSSFVSVDRSWLLARALPQDLIKAYVPISGPYDLRKPGGFVDNFLPDDSKRAEASPILNIRDVSAPAVVAVGSREEAYLASSRSFVDAVRSKGGSAELVVLEGMNHDATALAMGDSDGPLYAAVKSLLDTLGVLP